MVTLPYAISLYILRKAVGEDIDGVIMAMCLVFVLTVIFDGIIIVSLLKI